MEHPWYMRTEFWTMVFISGYGILTQTESIDAETAKALTEAAGSPEASAGLIQGVIGSALSTTWGKIVAIFGAPVAYIVGRSWIKAKAATTPAPTE